MATNGSAWVQASNWERGQNGTDGRFPPAKVRLRKKSPFAYTYHLPLGEVWGGLRAFQENGDKRQCLQRVSSNLMAKLDARKPQQYHTSISQKLSEVTACMVGL
jgi:hypothetical protein